MIKLNININTIKIVYDEKDYSFNKLNDDEQTIIINEFQNNNNA